MAKDPEPRTESPPAEASTPVPNRRERRGGKPAVPSQWGGKALGKDSPGAVPNPRHYSTRRRGR